MKSFCLIVLIGSFGQIFSTKDRVLIAVLSQESHSKDGQSYIAASYVKYLESAGARVVPVLINQNKEYYEQIVNKTDGLLFPGGGQDLHNSGYAKAGRMLWDYAINNLSRPYPIWGTCLGFELLLTLVDPNLKLNECDAQDVANNLEFTAAATNSRLFKGVDPIKEILSRENVTLNNHKKCLLLGNETKNIKDFFNILSNTKDKKGLTYISTVESKNNNKPVYGTQWHPEKNQFEFAFNKLVKNIPHTQNAILIAQYMANFFVNQCRNNSRAQLLIPEERKLLIFNYEPSYTGNKENYEFEQTYFFNTSQSNLWCVSFIHYLLIIIISINL